MDYTNIISLLGGIALFLFGMNVMGDALKRVAGGKLEVVLYRLTNTPLKGILLGTGVTAVIQSSSATSIMVVGFVNSGMMKVHQAIGIIMGAIIGTSVTGWILALNSLGSGTSWLSLLSTEVLTGIVAVIGIVLRMVSKREATKGIGDVLLGFAVLMYGMTAMSTAVEPLRQSEAFIDALTAFSNPLIGILIGLVFTAVIQSASAAVGILQALAVTGAVSFDIALPMIMGIAIGASVPVLLSSVGATVYGKRTAFLYLFIEAFGVLIWAVLFYSVNAIVGGFGFMGVTMNMVSIAFLNTVFRLVKVIGLVPFTGALERLVERIFPEDEDAVAQRQDMDRLEERFLINPPLAIEQSRLVINSMADKTRQDILTAMELGKEYSDKKFRKVCELEDIIDRYEDKLGNYLMRIMVSEMTAAQSAKVSKYLHSLTDLERVSDHARNLGECFRELNEKKIAFSDVARRELSIMEAAITEILTNTIEAYKNEDEELALRIEPLEEVIDDLCDEMKSHHVRRLKDGTCTINQGFIFNDMLTNYERVADHCSNIAFAVIEEQEENINNAHEYLDGLKDMKDERFASEYRQYSSKYDLEDSEKTYNDIGVKT